MGTRNRTPNRKRSSKSTPNEREHFTEENWLRWSNKQRLAFLQHQYDVLTAPDGKIAKAVGADDKMLAELAASISLLKLHAEADQKWAKWSMEEKLAHDRKLYERLTLNRSLDGRLSGTDAEMKAIKDRIEYYEHQITGTNNWKGFTEKEALAWLRKTHSMLTADGGKLARTMSSPQAYIDELSLRIAITQLRTVAEAEFDSWDTDRQVLHCEQLYYLYTKNGGQGAKIHSISKEFLDDLRSKIATYKKTSSDLKLIEQRAMLEADKLLKAVDRMGRRSPTIAREDILGKKGH